jgi:hypothetical protein
MWACFHNRSPLVPLVLKRSALNQGQHSYHENVMRYGVIPKKRVTSTFH